MFDACTILHVPFQRIGSEKRLPTGLCHSKRRVTFNHAVPTSDGPIDSASNEKPCVLEWSIQALSSACSITMTCELRSARCFIVSRTRSTLAAPAVGRCVVSLIGT